ncbi:GSCOCT00014146001.2-RA-CDS [Cotesia congregata]|uniref:Cc_odve66_23 n=1 Tax=Cotesia congregata TaxID=51543 RepID=A0A8J2E473_COTCN|nr:GSCOCT00014146001.2-RA-CDS [Cotesia congregata]CAG5077179.1 Cc_odve66_23 [Cotesia congregata]
MIAMSRDTKIFGLAILVCLVSIAIVIWIYQPMVKTNANKLTVKEIKKTLLFVESNLIFIKYLMKNYYDNEYKLKENDITIKDKALDNKFEDLDKEDKLREICVLGIKLLRNYLHDSKNNIDYPKAIINIIDQVLEKTKSINKGDSLDTDKWELYIVDIPHLMAMYYLIAEDDSSNTNRLTQCYEYITKVITSDMESTCPGSTSQLNFIKIGTPYLLTNYIRSLKDETCVNLYKETRKNKNLELLNRYLSYDTSEEVRQKYGVLRVDYGNNLKNKQAESFKCTLLMDNVKYSDLYSAVYDSLDVPGNIWKSLEAAAKAHSDLIQASRINP